MERERRTAGEVRAEGRRLSGTVLTFGEISPSHRERFAPGSIRLGAAVSLNLYHDRERAVAFLPGGGLEVRLEADAVRMVAELPPIPAADRALQEVRTGRTKGLSLEFRCIEDRRESGLRVIEAAELHGIGLVRAPSYGGSRVEARQRSGRTLRQVIPSGRRLGCQCSGADCDSAEFDPFGIQEMMTRAFEDVEGEILAVRGSYGTPLASKSRGSVRGRMDGDDAVVEVDLPVGPDGEGVLRDIGNVGGAVLVRPFLHRASESTIREDRAEGNGRTRVYTRPILRSLVVGATDETTGWPAPELVTGPVDEPRAELRRPERFLWL